MARLSTLALLFCLLFFPGNAHAYSVLSHEEVVDMAWPDYILPLLQQQYPGLTPDQIREAHAYAYGGCVIQDIGYYPFGDKQFSNMLHYIRTGDFVSALIRDSTSADELAFALGALAHYYGDTIGHPVVNIVTGEEYPPLASRFGRIVTYFDDETAHLRTEFGFDVVEVAHGHYSQENYRDFIGFQVSKPLLARAFLETYGLPMDEVLTHDDLAISTYRYSVSQLIPKMTKVALASYHKEIEGATPSFDKQKFLYRIRRTEFEKTYGRERYKPSFGARMLGFIITILPKVGPLRALELHLPNADEQKQYLASINHAEDAYRATLTTLKQTQGKPPTLEALDFDTGKPIAEGEYALTDKTYAQLVRHLADNKKAQLTPELLADINHFYADPKAKDAVRSTPKDWDELQPALQVVRTKAATPLVSPASTAMR